MKKTILLAICGSFFNLHAQDIPNAGFENWKNNGSYEDPLEWGTLNQATAYLGIKTVVKATGTEAHSGNSAIKLQSKRITALNRNVPGLATTGTVNTTTQEIEGGFPYSLRPVSLTGWFKYAPAGTDTASVELALYKWDAATAQRIPIGHARFQTLSAVTDYTRFHAPLTYVSALNPDTAVIILLSSQNNSVVVNSTFILDDLAFDFSLSAPKIQAGDNIRVYPDPLSRNLCITTPLYETSTCMIYDLAGCKLSESVLHGNSNKISVSSYADGIYLYRLVDGKHRVIGQGKFIVTQ